MATKSPKIKGKWYQNTFLWQQINLTEMDPVSGDLPAWEEYWKKNGVEGVIINCGGIVTYYQSKYDYQYRSKYLGDRDYFGEWNETARAAGLTVVARMDINATSREMFEQNPCWFCRDREGDPILAMGRYQTCINGGYYEEFIPAVLREIIEKYHPDGFVDNNWAGNDRSTICYCRNCQRLFREYSGQELPEGQDFENPVYRKWLRWSYGLRKEIVQRFNRITKEAGGEDCVWCGMLNGDPLRPWNRFYDFRELIKETPILFVDQQNRDIGDKYSFGTNTVNGRMIQLLAGENLLMPESVAHFYRGARTYRVVSGTRQEVRNWMLGGIAGGFAPWMHVIGSAVNDRRKLSLTDDIYRNISEKKTWLQGRTQTGDIAVLWNQESAVYYGRRSRDRKYAAAFRGFTQMLLDEGIPFLSVHASDLEKYEDRVKLVVVPNLAILTEREEEALISFMEAGKSLIFTDETGLYDGDGEWKGAGKLYEYLKLKVMEKEMGATVKNENDWAFEATHNYLGLQDGDVIGLKEELDTDLIAFGGKMHLTRSEGEMKPVFSLIPSFPIYPPEFAYVRQVSEFAGAYAGILENGARVAYLPAEVDKCSFHDEMPDLRKTLLQFVRWALGDSFTLRAQAPAAGQVVFTTYRKDGKDLLELLNVAGGKVPVGTFEHYIPIGPVHIHTDGTKKLGRVISLTADGEITSPIHQEGNDIVIDRLEEELMLELIPDEGQM